MDSMFLSGDELTKFSNCHTNWGKIRWLKANKFAYVVREDGSPITLRDPVSSAMKKRPMRDPIPTAASVKKLKTFPRNPCGVYFLILNEKIVYIGMSRNFFSRIAAHLNGEKNFDSVSFMEVPEKDVLNMEGELIARFNPIYNVMGRCVTAPDALEEA